MSIKDRNGNVYSEKLNSVDCIVYFASCGRKSITFHDIKQTGAVISFREATESSGMFLIDRNKFVDDACRELNLEMFINRKLTKEQAALIANRIIELTRRTINEK